MSYDALVWLLAGLGIGVAASLMLLIGYSMLEYGRLSRRFRKARVAAAAAAAVPVAPKTSILARPATRTDIAAKPVAEDKPVTDARSALEPKPAMDGKPARPTPVPASAPEAKPVAVVDVVPVAPVAEAAPEPVAAQPARRPQSVEAMFAEAFANDRLTVSPEPDEAAGAVKPDAEKSPG